MFEGLQIPAPRVTVEGGRALVNANRRAMSITLFMPIFPRVFTAGTLRDLPRNGQRNESAFNFSRIVLRVRLAPLMVVKARPRNRVEGSESLFHRC